MIYSLKPIRLDLRTKKFSCLEEILSRNGIIFWSKIIKNRSKRKELSRLKMFIIIFLATSNFIFSRLKIRERISEILRTCWKKKRSS